MGHAEEQTLWRYGVTRWEQVARLRWNIFSENLMARLREGVAHSFEALRNGDIEFFLSRLSVDMRPRILPEFGDRLCYVDCETTGLDPGRDHVTVVTLGMGSDLFTFVRGEDLQAFPETLPEDAILVTFNGVRFDAVFLLKEFGAVVARPHVDLMPILRAYGFTHGLKAIERKMGFSRSAGDTLEGGGAVQAWQAYTERADTNALAQLVAYNRRDAVVLREMFIRLHQRSMGAFSKPFCSLKTE